MELSIVNMVSIARSVIFCFLGGFSFPSFSMANQNIALLIGVDDYEESPLQNPLNDVAAIATALEARGWKATILENPSANDAQDAISALAQSAKGFTQDAAVMIYFSGHGFQMGSHSYMYFDGASGSLADVLRHSLSLSEALAAFDDTQAAKIILLDSCRSDPFGDADIPAASAGLTQLDAPNHSVIGFATAPYRAAYDIGEGVGPYADAVVSALASADDIDEFFRAVRRSTIIATNGRQVPWETSSLLERIRLGPAEERNEAVASEPSALTQQTAALSEFNRYSTESDNFAATVASFLIDSINAAPLGEIAIWDGRRPTEEDRQDFIATIEHELAGIMHQLSVCRVDLVLG